MTFLLFIIYKHAAKYFSPYSIKHHPNIVNIAVSLEQIRSK